MVCPQGASGRRAALATLRAVRRQPIRAGQRGARILLPLFAVTAVITGCSADEEQPSADLPPASSSAAETTPELPPLGPEDFPVPEEARTQDEAGAEAFLYYFVDLLNRQQSIPSGDGIRQVAADCQECLAVAQRLDQAAANGWQLEAGTLSVTGAPGVAVTGGEAKLSFMAQAKAGRVLGPDGEEILEEAIPAQSRLPSSLTLSWSESRSAWTASGFSVG